MKHSVFSASASPRWSRCPGSIALCEVEPQQAAGYAAQEGTALHKLSEMCLEDGYDPHEFIGEKILGIGIDEDQATDVNKYVEYVRGISGERLVEVHANYADLLGVPAEEGFGTSDTAIIDGRLLHIIDAKFGRRFVSPEENTQLILYGGGVVEAIKLVDDLPEEIHFHIVQPRVTAKPIPWELTLDELYEEIGKLKQAAQQAQTARFQFEPEKPESISDYLCAGETQCQWCPAKLACPAFQQVSRSVMTKTNGNAEKVPEIIAKLTGEEIAEWLDMVPILEQAVKSANHEAHRRLTESQEVPGWKLVKGRAGNRRWSDADAVEQMLAGEELEQEITHTEPKIKSPAQLEKALKGTEYVGKLDSFIVRSPPKPTLAPSTDPREPWSEAASVDEFEVIP